MWIKEMGGLYQLRWSRTQTHQSYALAASIPLTLTCYTTSLTTMPTHLHTLHIASIAFIYPSHIPAYTTKPIGSLSQPSNIWYTSQHPPSTLHSYFSPPFAHLTATQLASCINQF